MWKNLILITNEYPYMNGEVFLQNEISFLSNAFNNIYIFPINASEGQEIKRNIPNNVTVFPLNQQNSKIKYVIGILRGIKAELKALDIKDFRFSHLLAALYFRGKSKEIAKSIEAIIIKNNLNVNDVIIYSFWFAYQAIVAWLLSDKLRAKGFNSIAFSRAHGYDLYWDRSPIKYIPFQDVSLKKLQACFPCSDNGRNYLINKFPWASSKVVTERLGTCDFGINPYSGEITIATCCNLEKLKRMALFSEIFCDLVKEYSNIKWICIGDGEEFNIIKDNVNKSGCSGNVIMTGRLSNDKVLKIYKTEGIKYFCNISTYEGVPVSIMEAMSFGIPIIATDVGGTGELVDSENGFLIPASAKKEDILSIFIEAINIVGVKYNELRAKSRITWEQKSSASKNYISFCKEIMNIRN